MYPIVVVFVCVLGVSRAFLAIYKFWLSNRNTKNALKHNNNLVYNVLSHLYSTIIFKANYKIM